MPLTTGTRLGPFEVVEPLGAGGMGEVYRARDSRPGARCRAESPAGGGQKVPVVSAAETKPRELFRRAYERGRAGLAGYDVASDGRFLMVETIESAADPEVHFASNWADGLTARLRSR